MTLNNIVLHLGFILSSGAPIIQGCDTHVKEVQIHVIKFLYATVSISLRPGLLIGQLVEVFRWANSSYSNNIAKDPVAHWGRLWKQLCVIYIVQGLLLETVTVVIVVLWFLSLGKVSKVTFSSQPKKILSLRHIDRCMTTWVDDSCVCLWQQTWVGRCS